MWSRITIVSTMLVLLNACGSSPSLPVMEGKHAQIAQQESASVSPLQPLRLQAEKRNLEAQFALAQAYDRGRDVPRDKTESVRWYRLAAEQGDTFSQFVLGNHYWEGTGILKNGKEAIQWWQTAAAQGFAPAQNSLGRTLAIGSQAVPPDKIQAYVWLTLSAEQGDQDADQLRTTLAKQLNPDQIAKAKRLIKDWKPTRPRAVVRRSSP